MSSPRKFSIWRFCLLITVQCAALFLGIRTLAPGLWSRQVDAGWVALLFVFIGQHLLNAFSEWTFHRYILHTAPFSWVKRMAREHRHHHRLTAIQLEPADDGEGRVVLNCYPITEPTQYEASAFPWWALLGFWAFFSLFLIPLQLLLPRLPILLGGYAAIAWSLICYEVLHAIEHRPYEWWERAVEHPRAGRFWKQFYGFHHMHHANIRCNEAIGGFFTLPIADWVFGTYHQPEELLLHGRMATAREFKIHKPRRIVQWLDRTMRNAETRALHRTH
jgi:hemolysin III